MSNTSSLLTRFAAFALALSCVAPLALAQNDADADADAAASAFEQLLQQVQADPAGTTEAQIMELMDMADDEGRSYAASVAVKGYLSFHVRPDAKLLSKAALTAERAGDYRGAVARYKSLLEISPDNAAAAQDAGRLFTLLIDVLEMPDDAYGLMRRNPGKFRKDPLGTRYDAWFLDQAARRGDQVASAQRIAAAMSQKMPLELERLHYWDHMDRLFSELAAAKQAQFEAISPAKQIVGLIREDPRRKARADFYVANLEYFSNSSGKDEKVLSSQYSAVIDAAKKYFDADKSVRTLKDVYRVLYGGHGQWNPDRVEMHRDQMGRFLEHALAGLSPQQRSAVLNWEDRDREWVDLMADPATWTRLGAADAGFYKSAPAAANIPFAFDLGSLAEYQKSTAFLDGVPSYRAAGVNAMAAAAGKKGDAAWDGVVDRLEGRELWHLDFGHPYRLVRSELWPRFKESDAGQGVQDAVYNRRFVAFGKKSIAGTPVAMFDKNAVREYVTLAWRTSGEKDPTRKAVIEHLEALRWVPMDERTRRDVFNGPFNEFRNWAGGIRNKVKKKQEVPQEQIDAIAPIEAAFRAVMEKGDGDASKAPDELTKAMAEALIAIRKRDSGAYVAAARKAYGQLKGDKYTKTPLGAASVRWLVAEHSNINSTPVQLEILEDQLARWKPEGDNGLIEDVLYAVTSTRRDWSWGRIPSNQKDRAAHVNQVLEKAMLAQLNKGQFWPELFGDFRMTRSGRNWKEHGSGEAVARKIIEDRVFEKTDYRPGGSARSATVATMWLIRSEFPGLNKQFPVATYFDDMYVAEAKKTGYLDYRYWDFGRDENKKIVNAAADILAGYERLPLGYGDSEVRYSQQELEDWHAKALDAEPAKRDAMLAAVEGRYGKTRFDTFAMGHAWFLNGADTKTEDGRKAYFAKLKTIVERSGAQPARVGLPRLTALADIETKSLTKDEIDVLASIFPSAVPRTWTGGWGFEHLGAHVHGGLLANDRSAELALIAPHIWAIARDTNNSDYQRKVVAWTRDLARAKAKSGQELALVYATAGLDVMRGRLAQDIRTTLTTQRNQSLSDVAAVIPVKRSDPRYPVFASQAAFLTGREQAAWDMYLDHTALLPTMIKDLDPGYLIWVVQRDTAAAEYDRAESLAQKLLVWFDEAADTFDPELRGSLMLAYADIALAREDNPRARAFYDRIANATEFEGTRVKQRAQLQVADVDRLTGRYDEAIDALEKLSRQDDTFLQTESLYYLARVKHDQGQYKEALENLGKVFNRDPEHANARLLEGKVRIAVKDIETVTDIPIGDTALQRQIVPGKPLKVSLEDPNLAVVGSSADIEIRAWTDSGDEEFFTLLPFGDSKTKFRGQIITVLGPTTPGDNVLQVLGSDKVQYDFSDRFKAANNISLSRPPALTVASDAELYASSGEIRSREELEAEKLEEIIRERIGETVRQDDEEVALSTVRVGSQIKPGNSANIRVIDPDRSLTPGVDELNVRIAARSGDIIGAFTLKETDTHSGVFEGSVPTEAGQPTAYASDSADGSEPNYAIAPGDYPAWSGLADGQKPKTYTIDLNDNVALGKMSILADVPGSKLKAFTLQTSFNGKEFTTIGRFPEAHKPWDGTLTREVFAAPNLTAEALDVTTLARYLQRLESAEGNRGNIKPVASVAEPITDADLKDLKLGEGGLFVAHYRGAFFQDRRLVRTLKVVDKSGGDAVVWLQVNRGAKSRTRAAVTSTSYKASMERGVHTFDIFVVGRKGARPQVELQWDIPEPPYMATVPAETFDLGKHPEIREAIYIPPAQVAAANNGTSFDVAFDPANRARVVRLVLEDFEGGAPAISKITLEDRDGEQVLPTKVDFLELRRNQTLEIVPGDRITISYIDPVVNTPGKDKHTAGLTATYANGGINAAFARYKIASDGTREASYIPMRRFKAGDVIHVIINDPDLDVTDKPDTIAFTAKPYDGEPVVLEALESDVHSGVFVGKVFPVEAAPQRAGEIKVSGNNEITLSYLDEENTDPGVPWMRETRVEQAWYKDPELRVYDLTSRPLNEEELALQMDAEAKLRDAGAEQEEVPVRRALTAVRPEEANREATADVVIAAPMFVEVLFPFVAQSPESSVEIFAQAESARATVPAAGEPVEGQPAPPPFDIDVPGTVRLSARPSSANEGRGLPPGYKDLLVVGDPFAVDPLEDGRFTFNIPVEMGDTPTESYAKPSLEDEGGNAVRVLSVKGDDTVHLGFKFTDESGNEQWLTASAKLTSDHFFDVMDRKFTAPVDGLYVGQSAYLRVIHPSRNLTDDKDTIDAVVTTSSGKQHRVRLSETFTHSGIFKGLVNLVYADEEAVAEGSTLPVEYGDTVTLAYAPPTNIDARIEHVFDVFKGSDGDVFSFTKRFADPEMAVQTQFTIAEAHFELAKRYRELGQESEARRSIGQGKKLLEEAVRDHPDTKARAQADYLLANLSIEFAKEAVNEEIKRQHFLEAISRFSEIVTKYPDSPYAPKAQYKKAQSYEKMGEIDKACEEYVKLSYRYPDHELVAETIARLGQYFLTKGRDLKDQATAAADAGDRVEAEKIRMQGRDMFKTAAEVFGRLAVRFPNHQLADKTTVLSAQCYMQAERYGDAVQTFKKVIDNGNADKDLRAEAMYWAGDSYTKMAEGDRPDRNAMINAYRMFKNLTWDFPESKWAKFARGRLTEEGFEGLDG